MSRAGTWILSAAVFAAAGAAGWLLWGRAHEAAPTGAEDAAPPVASVAPSAPVPASSAPHYPVPAASAADAGPPTPESLLASLFGAKTVAALFVTEDFPRRFVATVDGLGRSAAPASVWPMRPAAGRFEVAGAGDAEHIGLDNGLRYAPYVQLLESVDAATLVRAYAAIYPQLQAAYVELGFPKGYFNDRFVGVLDQLIATPEPPRPLAVHLPPVGGPVQPSRPWVLYEYADSRLQALTAGQRLMLRLGDVNERRVKARLVALRDALVAASGAAR